jgi:hypothetical protein
MDAKCIRVFFFERMIESRLHEFVKLRLRYYYDSQNVMQHDVHVKKS